jgi:hypothetical protein
MLRNIRIAGRTRRAIVITLSSLLVLTIPLIAFANVTLVQISSDPYTNTTSQHKTEVEPDTFASGKTIVSAFQVGRFFDGGSSNIGFATSTNGGKSWTQGFLPDTTVFATPAGSYARTSDPTVAVDHFIPGLVVDPSSSGSTARLAVTFYYYPNANCTTAICQLNVGYSTSADGGASWTPNTQIAGPMSLTWLPNTTQGYMVGDYVSTSFAGTPAFPAIAWLTRQVEASSMKPPTRRKVD